MYICHFFLLKMHFTAKHIEYHHYYSVICLISYLFIRLINFYEL